jgi:hypothetical protein
MWFASLHVQLISAGLQKTIKQFASLHTVSVQPSSLHHCTQYQLQAISSDVNHNNHTSPTARDYQGSILFRLLGL